MSIGQKTGPSVDLTGRKMGYYNVIGWMFNEKKNCNMWLCECCCGEQRFNSTYELTSGRHKSCGCMANKIKSEAKTIDFVLKKDYDGNKK